MRPRTESLSDLAAAVGGRVAGDGSVEVTDVTHDSRRVTPGALYVALRGSNVDGHDYVPEAVSAGAAAVCVETSLEPGIPELVVDDTRSVLGPLAAEVHDHPSMAVDVVGVTGTNGKTTVTHYVDSIARSSGMTTGIVGTIHTLIAGESVPASMTTPEASEFQRLLATMRDRGVSLVAAEVSSHALEYGRVRGTRFAVAAFTNLSQDHLDFHGDMDSYRRAKQRLFDEYPVATAVFNIDDPVGADLAGSYQGESVTVGEGGDYSTEVVESSGGRTTFRFNAPWGSQRVEAPVVGEFNVSNLAVAAACSVAAGISSEAVLAGMQAVEGVPGRFQVVSGNDPITVIVDYAHTPEGVATALVTARQMTKGRVLALLGAGGDRDRKKRPAMGAALESADLAIVTSDNPRSEDPEAIIASVLSGMSDAEPVHVEADRRRAIDVAIDSAEDGDVVLVLGRGHEPYQQIGQERIPFDDREVARASLSRRRSTESGAESGSMSP